MDDKDKEVRASKRRMRMMRDERKMRMMIWWSRGGG